jgi:hypothetical protein
MTYITYNCQFIVYDIINALKIIQSGIEKLIMEKRENG